MADIYGGPTESLRIKDNTRINDILNMHLSMTSIVTSVVRNENLNETNAHNLKNARLANGILLATNYRVMSVDKVETIDGDIVQLVRLRNPFSNDFIGSWNKESFEWNRVSDEVKTRLNLKNSIEGEFWMTYNEFVKTFTDLEVKQNLITLINETFSMKLKLT